MMIGGYWYYFNKSGYRVINRWINDTYYVDGSGRMVTDAWIDGWYVDSEGRKVVN